MAKVAYEGFELDDDLTRLDIDVVWRYLSDWSYWGRGRSREFIELSIRQSFRSIGVYQGGIQIGFARVVSDGLTVAYLCDVFVLPAFQGKGIGKALVEEATEGAGLRGLKWFLHTEDAHNLYRQYGFTEPGPKAMERSAGWPTSGEATVR